MKYSRFERIVFKDLLSIFKLFYTLSLIFTYPMITVYQKLHFNVLFTGHTEKKVIYYFTSTTF